MQFPSDWEEVLAAEKEKPYFLDLEALAQKEYATQIIYPPKEDIYRALALTPFKETKVVILGQDPYHGAGQAQGLAFSVPEGFPLPPSLRNIFTELADDMGIKRQCGDLKDWAEQGVLLLNTTLTVRQKSPMSHGKIGWEILTDEIIRKISEKNTPVVFILWGGHARSKKRLIDKKHHLILEAPHPSPLSAYRGFFGSKPFSKANAFLMAHQLEPIDWSGHVF